jgi:hypothetical protein
MLMHSHSKAMNEEHKTNSTRLSLILQIKQSDQNLRAQK